MAKYEIIGVTRDHLNIRVEVEHEDGRRERFGFPLGEGYGEVNMNGELRCIAAVKEKLKRREEQAARTAALAVDLEAENLKHKGRIFEVIDDSNGFKKVREINREGKEIKRDSEMNIIEIDGVPV